VLPLAAITYWRVAISSLFACAQCYPYLPNVTHSVFTPRRLAAFVEHPCGACQRARRVTAASSRKQHAGETH